MKININDIKEIPKNINQKGFCIYGEPSEELKDWLSYHKFDYNKPDKFTNIEIPSDYDIESCFELPKKYQYMDGFSPNLNKHLHLGHVSNFILAKAFQNLDISSKNIANLGDTLTGDVSKDVALTAYIDICQRYGYNLDNIYFASQLTGIDDMLVSGTGDYEGTLVFDLDDTKVVGKKSDGSTSYFYQDVSLAKILNDKTLYLTGSEQSNHFNNLRKLFPHIEHLGLGLVSVKGEKMSSRKGNVIYLTEIIDIFKDKFGDDDKLVWNVLAGYILKYSPTTNKSIDLDQLDNPKLSAGLYISYTLAKLKSAGLEIEEKKYFNSSIMKYKYLKSKTNLDPKTLFIGIVDIATELSSLYEKYKINGQPDNHHIFKSLAEDMLLGMKSIGMFDIDRV